MAKITQGLTFGSLPTWAKGVVAVVGLLAIGGAAFGIYRAVKKGIEKAKENKEDKEFQKETNQEVQDLQSKGVTPTLSDANATSLASQIEVGLTDCDSWTTEQIGRAHV